MEKNDSIKIIEQVINAAYKNGMIQNIQDSIKINEAWQSIVVDLNTKS